MTFETIEQYQHTNRVQAEVIGSLKAQLAEKDVLIAEQGTKLVDLRAENTRLAGLVSEAIKLITIARSIEEDGEGCQSKHVERALEILTPAPTQGV